MFALIIDCLVDFMGREGWWVALVNTRKWFSHQLFMHFPAVNRGLWPAWRENMIMTRTVA